MPGTTFGVYVIGRCVGEGGMARIYQAEHAGLKRQVALKVLIDGFARNPEGRERFLREARMAAAVKHPNVVNIFDVGVQDGVPYMVMELLEGQDLDGLLASQGALDEATIVDIMVPVLAGLSAVHDAGIVHRDLKPGNIFLARGRYQDIEPKLLDFGICKGSDPEQLRLTAATALIGTPLYLSPEALQGGEITTLSDQYSLGVVMYECATGATPFTGATLSEISRHIAAGQYTPVAAQKPEVSRRLSAIIERAMSRRPQDRFKDLREMGRELLTLAGQRTRITWGLSFGERRTTYPSRRSAEIVRDPSPAPPAGRRWRVPAPRLLMVVAASLAVVIASATHVWRRGAVAAQASRPPMSGSSAQAPEALFKFSAAALAPGPPAGPSAPSSPLVPPSAEPATPAEAPSSVLSVAVVAPDGGDTPPRRVARPWRVTVDSTARRTLRTPAVAPPLPSPSSSAEPEAEWALPAFAAPSAQPKLPESRTGPNGAPIFD